MTTPSVKFSNDGLIALNQAELAYLQSYLDAGDRGGFYAAYYNITGNPQALEQLQIATFTGGIGGTAYVANFALQKLYGQSSYKGIELLARF